MNVLIRVFLIQILFVFAALRIQAQTDFKKIIPMSPNAAEISKYGEIPVGYFTGVPSIDIPLYHIKSKELELPLSLSYHAGGNRVESISSWVGLGWSLGSIPTITRSVNGSPDEGSGGYFYKFIGKTVKQLYEEHKENNNENYYNFLSAVKTGDADPEPDMYFYSINGKSGKFYYDQQSSSFQTLPKENINIKASGDGFIITSTDGTKYHFYETETSQSSGSSPGPPIVTGWMMNKMVNAQKTDSIVVEYEMEQTVTRSMPVAIKYQMYGGEVCGGIELLPPPAIGTTNGIISKMPHRITFTGGYVAFEAQTLAREDLNGGHALKKLKVYTDRGVLIKQFEFNQHYKQGSNTGDGCLSGDPYSGKWMFLTDVKEISTDNTDFQMHSFVYNGNMPTCRNSPAQDYWGYYNGAFTNTDLIPTVTIPGTSLQMSGADRVVNPLYTQFGILQKITYPTGGYTEFEFENNDSSNPTLIPGYKKEMTYIADESWEELPTHMEYDTTFVINNPPDLLMNGNNSQGGAFVKIDINNIGVPIGSRGGMVYIERVPLEATTIIQSQYSFNTHLPNGTYKLSGVFDQDPPRYRYFSCFISWNTLDATRTSNYVGGLRVKEIRNYDLINASPTVKKYSYKTDLNSTVSSGDVFRKPDFVFMNPILYHSYRFLDGVTQHCIANYYEVKSYSNKPQVTHSGSYVGYKTVFVQTNDPEKTGVSKYVYSHAMDSVINKFPFPPTISNETLRGQLLEQTDFLFQNNKYFPVKRTVNKYDSYKEYEGDKEMALKFGVAEFSNNPALSVPVFVEPYQIKSSWSEISKRTERSYNASDTTKYTEAVTQYKYSQTNNQLLETASDKSGGKFTNVKLYYPSNTVLSGDEEIARQWLTSNNLIDPVLKQEVFVGNTAFSTTIPVNENKTIYKNFNSVNLVKPYKIISKKGTDNLQDTTVVIAYSIKGNPLSVVENKRLPVSYVWSDDGKYPIAEIKNASYDEVSVADLAAYNLDYYGRVSSPVGMEYYAIANSPMPFQCLDLSEQIGIMMTEVMHLKSNKSYVFSYWERNAELTLYSDGINILSNKILETKGDWNFREVKFTGVDGDLDLLIEDYGLIQDIKIYPVEGAITSYTYKPAVGMASQTDARGKSIYYEYDNFQRLKTVKDNNGNVLKAYDYHIKQNP